MYPNITAISAVASAATRERTFDNCLYSTLWPYTAGFWTHLFCIHCFACTVLHTLFYMHCFTCTVLHALFCIHCFTCTVLHILHSFDKCILASSKMLFPMIRGCSSNGRAVALHATGTGIDALHLQNRALFLRSCSTLQNKSLHVELQPVCSLRTVSFG